MISPSNLNISKKNKVLLFTLCAIGLVYAFYFFGYVDDNEKNYDKKAYRNLAQVAKNLQELQKVNVKNVQSILQLGIELNDEDSIKVNNLNKDIKKLEKDIKKLEKEIEQFFQSSYGNTITTVQSIYNLQKLKKSEIRQNRSEIRQKTNKKKQIIDKNYKIKIKKYEANTGINSEGESNSNQLTNIQAKDFQTIYYSEGKDSIYSLFSTPLNSFVQPKLEKNELFNDFLIIRQGDSSISYQTFKNKIKIGQHDSLFINPLNKSEPKLTEIMVEGIPYKTFTYNFNFTKEESWLLIGCINKSDYVSHTRSINIWIVVNFFLVIIILCVALPLLKLAFMNSIERLYRSNVFFSGISIVVGAPLIILFALILGGYFFYESEVTNHKLKELNKNVRTVFREELKTSYNDLVYLDSLLHCDIDIVDRSSIKLKQFNEFFWMNSIGEQKGKVSQHELPNFQKYKLCKDSKVNLGHRQYFKAVKENNLWLHSNISDAIYFQSIVSWSTGEPEIAISKKSINDGLTAIAITSKLKSITAPILPLGYGYCFIDENGEVQIHSNKYKNLQENFLKECKNDPKLISAIHGKLALELVVNYSEKKHRAYISPLEDSPYYLVTFYNLENLKAKNLEIWSVGLFTFLASFFAVGLLIFLIYIVKYKKTKLLSRPFFFNWMTPKSKHYGKYKALLYSNLLTTVLIILFNIMNTKNVDDTLFRLFLIPIICFIINYAKLQKVTKKDWIVISFYYLLLNAIFYIRISDSSHEGLLITSLYQVIVFAAFYFSYHILNGIFEAKTTNSQKLNVRYARFLFVWLFQSSIIPIILIYFTYYTIESDIWDRYTLLDLGQKIELDVSRSKDKVADTSKIYTNFANIQFESTLEKKIKIDTSNEQFNKLLFYLRPNFRTAIIKNNGLLLNNSKITDSHEDLTNTPITYFKDSKSKLYLKFTPLNGNSFYLTQQKTIINWESYLALLVVVLGVILPVLFIFFIIIYYNIAKIYGLDYEIFVESYDFKSDRIDNFIGKKNIILMGLPGSGKAKYIEERIKNAFILDFRKINHKNTWDHSLKQLRIGNKIIVLENFEYNNENHKTNAKKLKLLEELLFLGRQLVIVSESHPTEIIDFYIEKVRNPKKIDAELFDTYKNEIEKWRHVFCEFIEMYLPIKVSEELKEMKSLYAKEMKYGIYLEKLHKLMDGKKGVEDEEIILEIQQYANSYYFGLWNALTNKEQFAIYDLAKDGFMNTKNKEIIQTLLRKGVLVHKNSLKLMNRSFTNFVLGAVKETQIIEMNKKVQREGKWVHMKIVIILVLLALVALISFGHPDFFNDINAIVFALAGVASILPALSGLSNISRKFK